MVSTVEFDFVLYSSTKLYNIKYNCYVNDTQVYMTLKPWDDISSSIEACIADISTWMNNNMLKLNKDKT